MLADRSRVELPGDATAPVGLPTAYYGGVERGVRNVSLVNIEKIAKGLKESLSELFRPRVDVDATRIAALRASGASWPAIAQELGIVVGTAYAVFQGLSTMGS